MCHFALQVTESRAKTNVKRIQLMNHLSVVERKILFGQMKHFPDDEDGTYAAGHRCRLGR
jgi:hypothetical protein